MKRNADRRTGLAGVRPGTCHKTGLLGGRELRITWRGENYLTKLSSRSLVSVVYDRV